MADIKISALKKCIFGILKDADLSSLSSKIIRRQCEERFRTDLSSRKKEIDDIVMSFVEGNEKEESISDHGKNNDEMSENLSSNGSSESDSDGESYNQNSKETTPLMKSNEIKTEMNDDADLARQLQEEEWNLRHRSRRPISRKASVKNNKKSESKEKPKVRKGTSTYNKKCVLSPELAEIMETNEMARPGVVKKMWEIVRERQLFDPSNKQFVFCDEQLIKVFGKKRIRMFAMMKYLRNHIKDKE